MNAAFSQGVYPMSNGNVACTHINIYTVLYTLVQKWFNLHVDKVICSTLRTDFNFMAG